MKAVFFDFDGTLTYDSKNIWKAIWQECGYDTSSESYYASLFRRFMSNEITHQEWCNLTCDEFRKAGFNYDALIKLAKNIKLIDGLEETLKKLKDNGFQLFVVSGNIISVIKEVLGEKSKYFDGIMANNLLFDKSRTIEHIVGTNYDFEGKANFISQFKVNTNSASKDLFFVGNGKNDEWAHLSGCNTICINPDETDYANSTKWHRVIDNVSNLTDVLEYILQNKNMEQLVVEVGFLLNNNFRYYDKLLKKNGLDLVFKCKTHDVYFTKNIDFDGLTENQIKNSCVRLRNPKQKDKTKIKELLDDGYTKIFDTTKKDYHYANKAMKSRIQLQIIKDVGLVVYYDNPDCYQYSLDKQRKMLIDELNSYGFNFKYDDLGIDKLRTLHYGKQLFSKNQNG